MEVMAVEELVAATWELEEFLVCRRHAIWLEGKSSYTDLDLVGVRQLPAEVRIAECKVQQGPRRVYCYSGEGNFVEDFVEWYGWDKFMSNITLLWDHESRPGWLPRVKDVASIQVWLCGNFWFTDHEARQRAYDELTHELRKHAPYGGKAKIEGRVYSTLDLILKCIAGVGSHTVKSEWGKRYGHPMLDLFREMVRYAHPLPEGGGHIGKKIAEKSIDRIRGALQGLSVKHLGDEE